MKRFSVLTALVLLIVASTAPALAQGDIWWNWGGDHLAGQSTVISISGVEDQIDIYKVPEVVHSMLQGGIIHFYHYGDLASKVKGATVELWELGIYADCAPPGEGTTKCGGWIPLGWIHRYVLDLTPSGVCMDCALWQLSGGADTPCLQPGGLFLWWDVSSCVSNDETLITNRQIAEILNSHFKWGKTQAQLDEWYGPEE